MKSSTLLPLLALLAGGLASGCWLALGIEDLSGEGLQTEAGGGPGPCSPGATASCANVEWAKIYGDKESQSSTSIAVDSAGNILLVGTYHGQIDFGGQVQTSAGGKDIFVAKLSPEGEFRWSRPVGDAANQYATGVAADGSDNVIVLGHFDGYADFSGGPVMSAGLNDIIVAKLSSDGNPIFTKRFGSPAEERSYSLAIDPLDNVLIAGFAAGDIDFGGPALMGANGLVLAKLSGSGDHIWSRRFSTDGPDLLEPIHIAADPSGGVVFTGSFGGSIYLDNVVEMTGPEDRDLLVAKLSPTGAVLWSEALGGREPAIRKERRRRRGGQCICGDRFLRAGRRRRPDAHERGLERCPAPEAQPLRRSPLGQAVRRRERADGLRGRARRLGEYPPGRRLQGDD